MADWLQPTIDSLKVDVLDVLKLRDLDSITLAENPTNPPIGAKRWNNARKTFQEWTAGGWYDLVIAIAGGGTGNGGESGAFGTMAYQNSDNVNITGGTIVESAIADTPVGVLARNAANEAITGLWTYNTSIHVNGSIRIRPDQASAGLERISLGDATNSELPAYIQAYEPGVSGAHLIVSNNYYGIDGGTSGRRNTAIGGSFMRFARNAVEIVGIDGAGNYFPYLSTQPYYVTAQQPNFQVGNGTTTATLQLLSNNLSYVQFMTGATPTGTIGHGGGSTYYDSNAHTWRTTGGAVGLATLDSAGTFASYVLKTNSGFIQNSGGGSALYLTPNQFQAFADNYYFTNAANTGQLLQIHGSGITMGMLGTGIIVGGPIGIGMRIYKSGVNAVFSCHEGASTTYWHNAEDTVQLMRLEGTNGGTLHPNGGMAMISGSGEVPAIRFDGALASGAFFSPQHPAIEWGANSATPSRAVMRTFTNGPIVDFVLGNSGRAFIIADSYVHFGPDAAHTVYTRELYPFVTNGYNCGHPTKAWYAIYSLNPLQITSDIRMKDVHGPLTNALTIVDSVDTFIASFKESLKPIETGPGVAERWTRKFPSFSAQDIKEKIDDVYGTEIVDIEDDNFSVGETRLMPIMWQAIKELLARVKALEPTGDKTWP